MTTAFANPSTPRYRSMSAGLRPDLRPFNPFIAEESTPSEVADAREVSYALIQSGPAVSPEEVESHLDAVEVRISWGTQVLALEHLEPGKAYSIGDEGDFVVPNFEGHRVSVVEARMGTTYAIVPMNACKATVSTKGETPREVNAGEVIALVDGMNVRIELPSENGDLTIEISSIRAGKKVPVGFMASLASGAAASIGLSFLGHTAIVAAMAMFMPSMNADDAEAIGRDQLLTMQKLLNASVEREFDKQEEQGALDPTGGGSKGGEPHKGESGAAGTTKPVSTQGHMAFKGSDDHVRLSRKDELALASTGGLVGILMSGAPATGHASPWATETQLGQDAENKLGAMFGADVNDAMGYGLGLWGTGAGGGGKGEGIGIDGIGDTVGGGGGGPGKWGFGKGDKDGWGNGHGPGRGGHQAKAPIVRQPTTFETNGRLPPEVIQRIVRQNFGRFRLCYETGLRHNPGLTGRVVTKFVIGRDGGVAQASDAGSDIASQEVISCVVRSFNTLSFPAPEGGIATVMYPIVLSPGE